jgi:hypothetical protein
MPLTDYRRGSSAPVLRLSLASTDGSAAYCEIDRRIVK